MSYNQPKLCPNASWNSNATTFANSSVVGGNPWGLFVTVNNTIYASDRSNHRVQIWSNNSLNPTKTISGGLTYPYSIFVTITGDIFVDNGQTNGRVDKWIVNTNTSVPVMYVNSSCYGLFIDVTDVLYYSMYNNHQVLKRWLNDNSSLPTTVAGTGIAGSTSSMLNGPCGIFVDTNLDLYVAECGNHRIQLFRSGQSSGITVAGSGSINITITLRCPTSIVLDADGYLFIADHHNHHIVGSGPNGFRCIVGCSVGVGGARNALDQLFYPATLSFDHFGNIYVTDWGNNRIQKFLLINSSGKEFDNFYQLS